MSAPTDADRERIRAWLDRPPQCDYCGGIGGHAGTCAGPRTYGVRSDVTGAMVVVRWRDFEREPCSCHNGVVVAEVTDGTFGFVARRCPRCADGRENGSVVAEVAPGTTNAIDSDHER